MWNTDKYWKTTVTLSCLMAFVVGFASCNDDDVTPSRDNSIERQGVSDEILEFTSYEEIHAIEEELQIPIHRGNDPPSLPHDFVYKVSPVETVRLIEVDNNPEEWAETFYERFLEHDSEEQKIRFEYMNYDHDEEEVIADFTTTGFIIGNGKRFSIFRDLTGSSSDARVEVISGILDNNGIKSYYMAEIIEQDIQKVSSVTGWSLKDSDGLSEEAEWPVD